MDRIHKAIRKRLLEKAGIIEAPQEIISLGELERTEWSPKFESLMRNRLIMGALRYGRLGQTKSKPRYDRTGSIAKRLEKYKQDGNLEHLVDIANLALCEFVESNHPKKHFKAHDDAEHTKALP